MHPSSPYRYGCGCSMKVMVPRGYDYREIKVKCGSTSPTGDPWQCDACARENAHIDFEAEAREWGEVYDED
jgi:hypothetical protein